MLVVTREEQIMDHALRAFVSDLLGVVGMALVPVVVTAFLSVPYTLNRHPGEPLQPDSVVHRHMT